MSDDAHTVVSLIDDAAEAAESAASREEAQAADQAKADIRRARRLSAYSFGSIAGLLCLLIGAAAAASAVLTSSKIHGAWLPPPPPPHTHTPPPPRPLVTSPPPRAAFPDGESAAARLWPPPPPHRRHGWELAGGGVATALKWPLEPGSWPAGLNRTIRHSGSNWGLAKPPLSCRAYDTALTPEHLAHQLAGASPGLPDAVRQLFRADAVAQNASLLIFVASGRSGHTLVGSLVDAHPNAMVSNELNLPALFIKHSERPRQFFLEHMMANSLMCGILGRTQTGYSYSVPGAYTGQWRDRISVIGDKKGGHLIDQIKSGRFARLRTLPAPT